MVAYFNQAKFDNLTKIKRFLVEFGKLMDNSDFNKDIKERLKDNESYPVNVIDKRIHFKDFYNTVAKESGAKLDAISKNIDKYTTIP